MSRDELERAERFPHRVTEVVELVDVAASGPVVVVGSLPPAGRDYDLMARELDRGAIEKALGEAGFEPVRGAWVRLTTGSPEIVELLTPADWKLPPDAADELFARATPLDGYARVTFPAPVHQVLIAARKLPRTPGLLEPKQRQRLHDALDRAPDAFDRAQTRARDWGVERRLAQLQARYRRAPREGWPPRYVRRPRRGAVIALSGLDGAGKTTQAEALAASLCKLGYDARVVWVPIGNNPALRRFASAFKRRLARLPIGPLADADGAVADRRVLSRVAESPEIDGRWRALAAAIWSTVITAANAGSLRRLARGTRVGGRIVIFDRYVLDTIVELRFSYAPEGRMPLQEALVRLLAPAPSCAFLLDLPAESAHARKPDWSIAQTRLRARLYEGEHERLGVGRLAAEQPAHELSAQILREVLEVISGRSPFR
jgi:thymidylate kinase